MGSAMARIRVGGEVMLADAKNVTLQAQMRQWLATSQAGMDRYKTYLEDESLSSFVTSSLMLTSLNKCENLSEISEYAYSGQDSQDARNRPFRVDEKLKNKPP